MHHHMHARTPKWAIALWDLLVDIHGHIVLNQEREMADATEIKAKLDAVLEEVSGIKTVQESINALFDGINAANAALKQQIADLQAQVGNAVDLQPISDSVDAIDTALDSIREEQAVITNTPAEE